MLLSINEKIIFILKKISSSLGFDETLRMKVTSLWKYWRIGIILSKVKQTFEL